MTLPARHLRNIDWTVDCLSGESFWTRNADPPALRKPAQEASVVINKSSSVSLGSLYSSRVTLHAS